MPIHLCSQGSPLGRVVTEPVSDAVENRENPVRVVLCCEPFQISKGGESVQTTCKKIELALDDSVGLIGHRLSAAVSTIWHRRRVECRRDLTPPSRGPQLGANAPGPVSRWVSDGQLF